jgi:thiol:disulfide interchange protein
LLIETIFSEKQMNKKALLFSLMLFATSCLYSQILEPIKWKIQIKSTTETESQVVFSATIDEGWHLYNMNLPEGGPVSTSFHFEKIQGAKLLGKTVAQTPAVHKKDEIFGMELSWFVHKALFIQKLIITNKDQFQLEGHIEFMGCNDESCLPPTPENFKFSGKDLSLKTSLETKVKNIEKDSAIPSVVQTDTASTAATLSNLHPLWTPVIKELNVLNADSGSSQHAAGSSWWLLFLAGFLGGLLALLTPCVWPIIPMTVSFFLKRNNQRNKAVKEALIYGLSIIIIYLALGIGITLIFGASALNSLSTNAIFNLLFFLMLVIFAISFFGAFEIVLPSSWTNKVDQKADSTTGWLSIFFMAFTLALVSFSCTGPIIGTLLVQAATTGSVVGPAIGMFGFALALAIPFALFALFPNMLQTLPKSGSWLQTVKVVLGFLELAFALKFLSVADLAYGWGLLSRQTFLILWIANFTIMGFWLLIRMRKFNIIRLMLALVSLAFAGWMVPGLSGASLPQISAFAPPANAQDAKLYNSLVHADFNDYEAGMAYAQKVGKPVLIDFSGYGCVNCRKMENSVWQDPEVKHLLEKEYVLITLMVDDKKMLSKPYNIQENGRARTIRSIGDQWSYLQRYKFGANAQPFYVLLDAKGQLLGPSRSYNENIAQYVRFLKNGLQKHHAIAE